VAKKKVYIVQFLVPILKFSWKSWGKPKNKLFEN